MWLYMMRVEVPAAVVAALLARETIALIYGHSPSRLFERISAGFSFRI
jgi:hypothetical protein